MKLKKKTVPAPEPPSVSGGKDLREIMDYSKEFTMFFSGVESDAYFNGCYDMGVRDFLMSYEYLKNSRHNLHDKYESHGVKIFIDSGAYTYQMDNKYRERSAAEWEKHIEGYLRWAERNRNIIFAMANLDLENLVGVEQVLAWNEKYFEPFMLRTGIPVCFVWHSISGEDKWEWYCKRYPYVGLTWVSDGGAEVGLNYGVNKLKIAEKHNTLVHGFGMTRTPLLPQLPFYTVDSTTWKSGFRYGQIAVWNRNKIQLIRRDGFKTKVFPIIGKYEIDPPLDFDKLDRYEEPEILRVNVFSYLKAEEYIREKLKPLTYWQKARARERTSVESVKFPSPEWINSPEMAEKDWERYADEFNISKVDKNLALSYITDMTILLNWDNPEYREYRDRVYTGDVLKELHNLHVNTIRSSFEDELQDLVKFYTDNLLGKDTTLLYLGTNFDRMVKERENYLDDTEYETVDADSMEVENALAKYLPAKKNENDPAPEISELDDEIFEAEGFSVVRDSHGRFIKGQKRVPKPKKMYSEKFPKLSCDACISAQKCPEYKKGYVCAFNKVFDKFNTRDMGDVLQAMQGIVSFSMVRLQRAMVAETLNGGIPDPAVSVLMNQSMSYLSSLQKMYEVGSREVVKQTKVLRSDGTQEMTTQVMNPTQGTGILEKIFGNMGETKPDSEV